MCLDVRMSVGHAHAAHLLLKALAPLQQHAAHNSKGRADVYSSSTCIPLIDWDIFYKCLNCLMFKLLFIDLLKILTF